jgi:hypothetical protein
MTGSGETETATLDLRRRRVGQETGGRDGRAVLLDRHPPWVVAMDYRTRFTGTASSRRRRRSGASSRHSPWRWPKLRARGSAGLRRTFRARLIFGGEEWWHYGPRIKPGDRLTQRRWFHDYKSTDTKFAGPTLFTAATTPLQSAWYTGVQERSTSIRYLAAEAERRGPEQSSKMPRWAGAVARGRRDTGVAHVNRGGTSPFADVSIGDRLLRRVRPPRFELRDQYPPSCSTSGQLSLGGARRDRGSVGEPGSGLGGWLRFRRRGSEIDPRLRDGLYVGPSRGAST